VLFQCEDCAACTLKQAQCEADVSKKLRFRQKFEAPRKQQQQSSSGAGSAAGSAAGTGHSAPLLAMLGAVAATGFAALFLGMAALRVAGANRRRRTSAEVYLRAEASETGSEVASAEEEVLG